MSSDRLAFLPDELGLELFEHLDIKSAAHFAQAQREHHRLFKECKQQFLVKYLLKSIVLDGNPGKAMDLPITEPNLALVRGKITDRSGTVFTISFLEYAYWSYDVDTMKAIFKFLSIKDKKTALNQLEEFKKAGADCRESGQETKESKQTPNVHFDVIPLDQAYATFLAHQSADNAAKVAFEQKRVPPNLINDIVNNHRVKHSTVHCASLFHITERQKAIDSLLATTHSEVEANSKNPCKLTS